MNGEGGAGMSAERYASLATAFDALRAAIVEGRPTVVSIDKVDSLTEETAIGWLDAMSGFLRVAFFDGPAGALTAGAGVAAVHEDFETLESNEGASIGGWRFDPAQSPAPEWQAFGRGAFVLPRVAVERTGGTHAAASVRVNFAPGRSAADDTAAASEALQIIDRTLAWLRGEHAGHASPSVAPRSPFANAVDIVPTFDEWSKSIDRALTAFAEHTVEKVVLARRSHVTRRHARSPVEVLARWRAAEPRGYAFLLERPDAENPQTPTAFLGVTPELLWRRDNDEVELEAVAGTRPRGATPSEDQALAQALLDDDKERREHASVRDFIARQIPHCRSAAMPEVRKLGHVQHLVTPMRAPAPPKATLRDLAPTPAVCGVPRDRAFALVADLEPFDRGFYAGAIGVTSSRSEAIAVGIRSLLLRGDDAYIYAGAGLVAGSIAEREWREVQTKERGARAALGLDDDSAAIDHKRRDQGGRAA